MNNIYRNMGGKYAEAHHRLATNPHAKQIIYEQPGYSTINDSNLL